MRYATLLLVILLAGCAPAPAPIIAAPSAFHTLDPSDKLRSRPVKLLRIEAGAECPRAHPRQITPDFGPALGDGPVYAAGFDSSGVLNVSFPAPTETVFYGSEWSGAKVLWFVDPSYQGPVLIRGGRLDGPDGLRFETGNEPPSELWIEAGASANGWRNQPSYTRVRSPGCYMYQVDGTSFTEAIIFEAKSQP